MSIGATLNDLAAGAHGRVLGDGQVRVVGVQHDSRRVVPGDLFFAIAGEKVDGSAYAETAHQKGAVAVATEVELPLDLPQLIVQNGRQALGPVAEEVFGRPTRELSVVGITGTNGKTTTAWLIESALAACSAQTALIGTVLSRGPGICRPAPFTTPEGDDISHFAREVADAGATHLIMEVSSHGLALHRVDGVSFEVAAFTNLTHDHLDFHGDMESYGRTKARLFEHLGPKTAVINVDDAFGASLAARIDVPTLTCSCQPETGADIQATRWRMNREGLSAEVRTPEGEVLLRSPLLGAHNLENLLVALGCGIALNVEIASFLEGLAHAQGAPGRLERVADPRDVAVLVDYAHTPDALARALAALRPVTPGRLIVVFGCGGDRDRDKRPRMGQAAAEAADLCLVTSDNPRTEDPQAIVDQILVGVRSEGTPRLTRDGFLQEHRGYMALVDRAEAIAVAVEAARAGDTVLIAGKGHEDYQIVGHDRRPFDDRKQAQKAIAGVGGGH